MNTPFTPRTTDVSAHKSTVDGVEVFLQNAARLILLVSLGALPVFFLPVAYAPFDYSKVLLVLGGLLLSLIFYSLSVLRSGAIKAYTSLALLAFWGVALVSLISAMLSGDLYDSLIGDTVQIHTVLFTAILALIATVLSVVGNDKMFIMRLYICITASAIIIGLFHILRLLFGANLLSLGVFTSPTSTMLGSWNDLALFFGLCILLSLVALEQLPLTRWGRVLFAVLSGVSLLMLMVINFFPIWIILGLVSLIMVMYILTKDRFGDTDQPKSQSISYESIVVSVAVFVTSFVFIIGGSVMGGFMANLTGISYTEVRPSVSATLDIVGSTYSENAFTGVGPNRFVDAWRLYKDPSLNETIFWSTDFAGASGYLPTQAVTHGVLGVIAWLVFLGLFFWFGLRTLLRAKFTDRFWYFIATSSFVAAAYLWIMLFMYNPTATILVLTAIFTGINLLANVALVKAEPSKLTIATNRRAAFVLIGLVMVVIVVAASSLFYLGRHYAAVYTFAAAVANPQQESLEAVEQKISNAFVIVNSDAFVRQLTQFQLAKMNTLINVQNPTPEQSQAFRDAAARGVATARTAVDIDPTDARNWALLARVSSVLAVAGVEGAAAEVQTAISRAQALDPANPSYLLLLAQSSIRAGDIAAARQHISAAIQLKSNYTDALFLLAQLEVAEGNVEQAITATQSIISFEPNNPARYYQLGVLATANGDRATAVAAFERAVRLDPSYANARYLLALAYIEEGRTEDAIAQLEVVRESNADNQELATLIAQLQSGTFVAPDAGTVSVPPVSPDEAVATDAETVTTTAEPDTSLIVPLNPVPEANDESDAESTETTASPSDESSPTTDTSESSSS